MQVASILFAAAFTFLTCLAIGKMLLRTARAKLVRSEELFFGFVLGAACLSIIVLLLGVLGLVYSWVFLIVGCAAIAAAYVSGAMRFTSERPPPLARPWLVFFACFYGLFAVLDLGNALAPETSSDGTMFHVALPALYVRQHAIPAITSNFLASFSEGMEMLFTFAFSFGKHSATAMVHLLFTLLLPLGMLSYARRIGKPVAGVAGALLVCLSPMVAQNGTIAYVDVALATVIFAVFCLLRIWWQEPGTRLLIPIGVLAGFAYGIKYTAFLAFVYALGVVALRLFRLRKSIWRPCAVLSLSAFAVIAPWMIKNAVVVNNPVSPFANRVFRNPYVYVSSEQTYTHNMGSLEGVSPLRLPYEVTVRGGFTQGFLGPVFLLAPLALLALTASAGRQLLFAAALFAVPFASYERARILLPALPFVALAFGLVLSRWPRAAISVILVHAVLSWPSEISRYASRVATRPSFPDWRAALRLTPESEYLGKHIGEYGFEMLLEAKVPPKDRVFSFRGFSQAYHSAPVLVEWQSALGVRLGESLRAALQRSLQPIGHLEFHFEPRTVRKVRLVETARGGAEQWSVSELRFFRNGTELLRAPEWRLWAFPNPWDVQRAFDNSPLTRWASREQPRPGMFVEVDFGRPQTVDQASAECTPDQEETRMELQFESAPAQGQTFSSQPKATEVAMPERLRRAAIEELMRYDVRWLVVYDLDPGARDFRLRQAQWGITVVGTAGRFTLYRLE